MNKLLNEWWTDYPLYPEEYSKKAPKRKIKILSYDGDKYCKIDFNGEQFEIKAGYIYPSPERVSSKKACKRLINFLRNLNEADI